MIRLIGYLFRFLKFIMTNNHLFISLLSLEGIIILVINRVIELIIKGLLNIMGVIIFIIVIVGEGVIGLGILVRFVRGVGDDKFYYINIL